MVSLVVSSYLNYLNRSDILKSCIKWKNMSSFDCYFVPPSKAWGAANFFASGSWDFWSLRLFRCISIFDTFYERLFLNNIIYKVLGMIAEGNYGKNFNSSLYNLTVPFGAIVERIAKQKLMQMQKQYPHANFYVYGYVSFSPNGYYSYFPLYRLRKAHKNKWSRYPPPPHLIV